MDRHGPRLAARHCPMGDGAGHTGRYLTGRGAVGGGVVRRRSTAELTSSGERVVVTAASSDSGQAFAAPRAAAVAGVIFSLLLIVGLVLIRLSVPADPGLSGTWVTDPDRRDA